MIRAQAVEAAAKVIYSDGWDGAPYWESMADDNSDKIHHHAIARAALEAAAPHMLAADSTEAKLAAVIVALDPFERVAKWMATDDEAGRYALEAIQKIRAILDGTPDAV